MLTVHKQRKVSRFRSPRPGVHSASGLSTARTRHAACPDHPVWAMFSETATAIVPSHAASFRGNLGAVFGPGSCSRPGPATCRLGEKSKERPRRARDIRSAHEVDGCRRPVQPPAPPGPAHKSFAPKEDDQCLGS